MVQKNALRSLRLRRLPVIEPKISSTSIARFRDTIPWIPNN